MAKCYSKRKLRGKRVAITATSVVADVQYSEVGAPLSLSKEQLGIGKTDRDVQVQCKEAIRLSLLYQQKLVLQ